MPSVSDRTIVNALHLVPPQRWGEVHGYLQTLTLPSTPIQTAADLLNSGLVSKPAAFVASRRA